MKNINIVFLMLLMSSSVMAQQTLTLNACREKSLEHNKSLQSAKLKEEQMDNDVKSYRANYFPKIDIMAGDVYSWGKTELTLPVGGMASNLMTQMAPTLLQSGMITQQQLAGLSQIQIPDQTMEFKIKNTLFAGAVLTQPIYMGGKITAAYKMSRLGKDMAVANIRLRESEVIVETDQAYMLAVKAKKLMEVAKSYKTLLDELQQNVDAAVKHGMKMRNDALKVQVKRSEAELNIQKAENAYRLACMNLCQVIGIDLNSNITVDDKSAISISKFTIDAKQFANASIATRPEYEILQKKSELAQKKVRLAQSDYLPQVALMGGYSYLNGMELDGRKLFDSGSPSIGVTVKIPVLEFFTQGSHKIRSARAEHQIAQLEQEELNEKMTLELAQCANNLSEAILEVDIAKKSKTLAEENMMMSKQQYEVGTEPLSDYLEAQAIWQQASANEIEAMYMCFLANTKYLKASGQLK
ncbi:MAG: TolC family protein [Bacteroidaceae bacterium]|nr:TolC family protein [Bacteroidaceae bacterium]